MNQEQTVRAEHAELYQRYLDKVHNSPCPRLMWVVLDNDHCVEQFTRSQHIWWMSELMRSGQEKAVKVGIEAMSRTLGEWSMR
jgi:hypothetical protein